MLDKILIADKDAQNLKILSRFSDIWGTFEETIIEPLQTYQNYMKVNHKKKDNIITYCMKAMRDEEKRAEKKSIAILDELKGKKKYAYRTLDSSTDRSMQIDEIEEDMINAVNKVEDDLMDIEMLLQDALHTAMNSFKDQTHGINAQLKAKTKEFIDFVLDQANEFNKEFFPYAMKEQGDFIEDFNAKQERGDNFDDDEEFNDKLLILGEKDDLIQMLEQSKDFIEKEISARESDVNKSLSDEEKRIEKMIEKQ